MDTENPMTHPNCEGCRKARAEAFKEAAAWAWDLAKQRDRGDRPIQSEAYRKMGIWCDGKARSLAPNPGER